MKLVNPFESKHFMFDVETTGLKPWKHQITSIGVKVFDFTIGNDFEKHLESLPEFYVALHYSMDEELCDPKTMKYRKDHGIEEKLYDRVRPYDGMVMLLEWLIDQIENDETVDYYAWAKPLSFDIPFIQRYMDINCQSVLPFHHRNYRDAGTFVESNSPRGDSFYDYANDYKHIELKGDAHNALDDARYQALVVSDVWNEVNHYKC